MITLEQQAEELRDKIAACLIDINEAFKCDDILELQAKAEYVVRLSQVLQIVNKQRQQFSEPATPALQHSTTPSL